MRKDPYHGGRLSRRDLNNRQDEISTLSTCNAKIQHNITKLNPRGAKVRIGKAMKGGEHGDCGLRLELSRVAKRLRLE